MPLYQFLCNQCKHQEDFLMQIKDYRNTRQCCVCGETMRRVFTPVAIVGGEWDWKKGYRTGINDSVKEVKYDMMRLEQNMTEEGNLKKYHEKKQALAHFAEAHEDLLSR